jgi:hypothetical protein
VSGHAGEDPRILGGVRGHAYVKHTVESAEE